MAPEPVSGAVVVLRPTSAQRVVGALSRAACATPLLLGALLGGGMVVTALAAMVIAGSVVFVLDLLVRRDQEVQLGVDHLVARGRTYPWWAIDTLVVRERRGRRDVLVGAFGLPPFPLDAPSSSVVAPRREFDREVALLLSVWERLRSREPGEPVPAIDLTGDATGDAGTIPDVPTGERTE